MPSAAEGRSAPQPWWKSAVVYQVYPRSFADADGNGVGDLAGIRRQLDHLSWLGVDAIWISPFYPSPMADAGYDVADYCGVDPLFGTLDEFDDLLADAHARNIRVLVDWVPNHTSDQHPWFVESRASRSSPKRAWYIWRDAPNNWVAAFGAGSAWTWDERTAQYYLHLFLTQQPDLNWTDPDVIEAMHGVLRFWLDRGVDGFRIDVAHCIGKDPTFADDPRCGAGQPVSDFNDQPYSHEVLRGVRQVVDAYRGDRVTVGEVNIRSTAAVARYYGDGDELHLAFNFLLLDAPWHEGVFRRVITEVESNLASRQAWPTWVLSNHDNDRHRTRYGGSERRARAAAVLLLTLRGTPFLFEGEELGLEDAIITPADRVDPGGRDGVRAPMPWTSEPDHGWHGARPWLPFPPAATERNAETLRRDPASILTLYRDMLAVRRASPALSLGTFAFVDGPDDVLAYRRHDPETNDERIIAVNFAAGPSDLTLDGAWIVDIASDEPAAGVAFKGKLEGEQAVVLRRSPT